MTPAAKCNPGETSLIGRAWEVLLLSGKAGVGGRDLSKLGCPEVGEETGELSEGADRSLDVVILGGLRFEVNASFLRCLSTGVTGLTTYESLERRSLGTGVTAVGGGGGGKLSERSTLMVDVTSMTEGIRDRSVAISALIPVSPAS